MTSISPYPLTRLQVAIADRLRAWPSLQREGLQVIVRRGQIDDQVASALAESNGIAVVVFPAVAESINDNLPGPVFERGVVEVHVLEDNLANNVGLDANEAAQEVMRAMHHHALTLPGGDHVLLTVTAHSGGVDGTSAEFVVDLTATGNLAMDAAWQ